MYACACACACAFPCACACESDTHFTSYKWWFVFSSSGDSGLVLRVRAHKPKNFVVTSVELIVENDGGIYPLIAAVFSPKVSANIQKASL